MKTHILNVTYKKADAQPTSYNRV